MKFLLLPVLFLSVTASAQYYYKDIVGTRESSELIRLYLKNGVSRVGLNSFDATNKKDEEFFVEQLFTPSTRSLRTTTRSGVTNESILISYADEKGNVIRTFDSSEAAVTETNYRYDASGNLVSVVSNSTSGSDRSFAENEQHLWSWSNSKPQQMVRIKNGRDTTRVSFKLDDQGNVAEETETHKGVSAMPVYYYYNDAHNLTDIVRFSKRANRLLPEYMFEYGTDGSIAQKITVPDNNSEYLIWRYQYNDKGLKTKEVIYNRQKKLTGKIEYQYSFGS